MVAQEPATVLGGVAISKPASGNLLRSPLNARQIPTCVVLHQIVPGIPALPLIQDFRPGRWQIRICRLSISAITTVLEHDHGSDRHPARPAEGYPSALRFDAGGVTSFEGPANAESPWATCRRPSCHRFRGRRTTFRCCRRLPTHEAWELCPNPDRPGHLMSRPRVHAGRRSRRGVYGTVSPRARRRTAQGHPRQGCISQLSAKKVRIRAPEVSSINGQPRRAGSWSPQVVTNLWTIHVRRLYNRRDRSQGVDLPGESVDSTAQLNPPERTTKQSQRPQRFLR